MIRLEIRDEHETVRPIHSLNREQLTEVLEQCYSLTEELEEEIDGD